MLKSDGTTTLLDKTRFLLIQHLDTMSLKEIAELTNLPIAWLRTIEKNQTSEPSVNRIQHLFEVLSERKLDV